MFDIAFLLLAIQQLTSTLHIQFEFTSYSICVEVT